jgi:hypothetical protein
MQCVVSLYWGPGANLMQSFYTASGKRESDLQQFSCICRHYQRRHNRSGKLSYEGIINGFKEVPITAITQKHKGMSPLCHFIPRIVFCLQPGCYSGPNKASCLQKRAYCGLRLIAVRLLRRTLKIPLGNMLKICCNGP